MSTTTEQKVKAEGVPEEQKVNVPTTRSNRAGVVLPLARIEAYLKEAYPNTTFKPAARIYLAAVVESSVVVPLATASAQQARDKKRKGVMPSDVNGAVRRTEVFKRLLPRKLARAAPAITSKDIATATTVTR
jgi:histone H3/H4